MNLSPIEAHSPIWAKIKQHLQERLEVARARNDGDLDAIETARLRGRIQTLKELIALDESPVPVADEQL